MEKENSKNKKRVTKNNLNDNEFKKNLEGIEKEIKNKKELPNDEKLKINKKIFENILIANIIMAFLFLIILGSLNIDSSIFITDLKVFSMMLIIFTIILFEYSYRKENGNVCIHGIECMVLAIFILVSVSLYSIYFKEFYIIVTVFSLIFAIYYLIKAVVIYKKMRKKYIESTNDISEIIKK